MNNQNDNQTKSSSNDQDVLNKYASSVKPNTEKVTQAVSSQPTESSISDIKEPLKEFNATPIDAPPTPTSLSDNLEASKSLVEESVSAISNEPESTPKPETTTKPESPVEPKIESTPEPEIELKPEPKTEITPESEITPPPEVTPEPQPESTPEPEIELKPEPKIVQEMDSGYNSEPQPTIQTETNSINQPQENPEKIKQKIEEVLSYNTVNSVVNSKSDKPKTSRFLKTIFTLSLITFIAVFATLAYFYFNPTSKINLGPATTPTETPTQSNAPTQTDVVCELNGFIYKLNQSFPAADGCNTCTCVSADNITCTEKVCTDVTTTPATSSSIPKDWKTYTDSTYKFSISYPREWVTKTYPEHKNIIVFQSPEGKQNEELDKSLPPGDRPTNCGEYQINCYKSFAEINKTEIQEKNINSLSNWLKTSQFKDFSQSTINGFVSYSVTQLGLSETKQFYIQNKDTSFCQITFCGDRDLNSIEKQFINSFKFN